MRRVINLMVGISLVVAACGGSGGPDALPPGACAETTAALPAAAATGPDLDRAEMTDPAPVSLAVSDAAFSCASDVVVVPAGDPDVLALGARLAAGLGGPVLVASGASSSGLEAEIDRLGPLRVHVAGIEPVPRVPGWTEIVSLSSDPALLAAEVNDALGVTGTVGLPQGGRLSELVALVGSIRSGAGLTVRSAGPASSVEDAAVPVVTIGAGATGSVWLVDAGSPDLAFVAAAAAAASGGSMAVVDGTDLRRITGVARALRRGSTEPAVIHLLGDMTADAEWQVRVLLEAPELPGGGLLMVPGRRLVALYGSPLTDSLGVLGEQGPEESVARLAPIAAEYGADGLQVVPTFEIITTVASGSPGSDGDYSTEWGADVIRPWIDVAGENGVYVLLDLQPGRTDFLTQAKLYEDLLTLPHVGLALDPEWRLKPGEVHLEQIGVVTAAEVNTVVDWLAALTRRHALPQKVLLIHQFDLFMIEDRETLRTPPELAVIIQVDGHGTMEEKMNSWQKLTRDTADSGLWWGWKNFYDEDDPTPTPEHVLSLDPTAVYVSYQ